MRQLFDLELILPVVVLVTTGLTTLFVLDRGLFQNQLIFTIFGIIAFLFFSFVDFRNFKYIALPVFLVSVVLLFALLFIGIETRGAVRWFDLGIFKIQISEILKPFLVACFAAYLCKKEIKHLSTFILSIIFIGLTVLPIFIQPDLGNTLIYLLVPMLMLLYLGLPFRFLGAGIFLAAILSPILWFLLRDYQKDRLISFLNPGADPQGISYNLIQSVIAVGGGQLFGRGLGFGTQSQLAFLPERHTDFIFATLSEYFGFFGAVVVLGAFAILLFKLYKIAGDTQDSFLALVATGAFAVNLFHLFINIGGNIGVLPVTGITLPLVSYGGSSIISTFILLGIVNSINKTKIPKVLEIR